jgi:hypothetical protein
MNDQNRPSEHTSSTNDQGITTSLFPSPFNLVPPPEGDSGKLLDDSLKNRKFENVQEINEADLRNALLVEAKRRKVWGAKTINKMVFENIEHSCCYHYILESFTETRSTAEGTEAYTIGQYVENHGDPLALQIGASTSGSSSMYHTNPWDYEVLPDEDFKVSVT